MRKLIFAFLIILSSVSLAQNRVCLCVSPTDIDPVVYPEYPAAALTKATNVSVTSSIDPSVTIKITIAYPTAGTNLPMLVFAAGYHDAVSSFDADVSIENTNRITRLGYFLLKVDTRGGGTATGTFDDGGREAHDIYDAIRYVQTNYSSILALNKISYFGYSRGGGMGLLMASRYPDLLQSVTDYFGISNWGGDATYGWYEQEPSRQSSLSTAIGGTPAAKPDEYKARWSKSAVAQNFTGFISIYHDVDDSQVQVDHSQQVVSAFTALSKTNYYYSETNSGSTYRWVHGYPATANNLIQSESTWLTGPNQRAKMYKPKVIPSSGTLNVIGAVYTKLFSVVLNDGTSTNGERSRIATLVYNVQSNSYEVTNTSSLSLTAIVTLPSGETASQSISAGDTATLNPI